MAAVKVFFYVPIAGGQASGFLLQIAREKVIYEQNKNGEECLGVGKFVRPLKCFLRARMHRAWLRTTTILPWILEKNALLSSGPMFSINVRSQTSLALAIRGSNNMTF